MTTKANNTRHAAQVFHPGVMLLDELNERQLTQAEFSAIIDRPAKTVNEIIKGKRGITPETAEMIAAALGTSADIWLGMQAEYDLFLLNKKTQTKTSDVKKRSELYNLFPIADLVRRKYITVRKKVSELETEVLALLDVATLTEFRNQSLAFYRTSEGDISLSYLNAWVLLGKKAARDMKGVGKYNKEGLLVLATELKHYSRKEDGIKDVVKKLSDLGVRVVILHHFSKTRVDGAACWLDNESPVILLSLRYDRIDNFYFTLLHEIGHLIKHETSEPFVDVDIFSGGSTNEKEKEANSFAIENLGFGNVSAELKYSEINAGVILRRSEQLSVHPGLLVGHLQHTGLIDYNVYRKALVKVSPLLPEGMLQR